MHGHVFAHVLEAAKAIRDLLCMKDPPIQQVVDVKGLLPRMVEFLSHDDRELQLEIAWSLSNIAAGSTAHVDAVVQAKAIQPLIDLLSSPDHMVARQALWALGNIAADSSEHRAHVLSNGIVKSVTAMCERELEHKNPNVDVLKTIAWVISNLLRYKPMPAFDEVLTLVILCS